MKENSNGTDKNVGSIEEDIKILERIDIKYFLSGSIEQSNYIVEKADEVNEAIEHILSDYKRVLEENEKQEKLIEKMKQFLLKENKMCNFLESEEK